MKWAGLAVLIIMIVLALYVVWFIGGMPGRVAEERNHPKAQAIKVGGWATLIFGVVGWPWVLMWAYSHTPSDESQSTDAGSAIGDPA